ncbi:MAG TPA: hypothetical protein DGT23_06730 [Micromonosporaceae bacterium]|nr:hypothetical protein [Micromonosporaceae bacterium]
MAVARSNAFVIGLTVRQAAVSSLALVAVITLGWFFTVRQAEGIDGAMAGTMGMDLVPFLVMWLPMVVAMMFPTVGPSAVTAVHGERTGMALRAFTARTAGFLASYLVVWMLFGLAVYVLLDGAAALIAIPPENAKWVAAGIYAVAGLYQFTPAKDRCRARCQSTRCADVDDSSTHAGRFGRTVRAGALHGLSCIGCCVAFMVVLIAVGMTNFAAMAALTIVIFVERHVFRRGAIVSRLAGVLLLLAAALTPFVGWLHPGLPGPDAGDMPM